MCDFKTEQEKFWAGDFGNAYIERNEGEKLFASNLNFFSEIFCRTAQIQTVFEIGANIGMNIEAINKLLPESKTSAVELNKKAVEDLKTVCTGEVFNTSVLDLKLDETKIYDFVFTKGVLIHINPEELSAVYERMFNLSGKYICLAEYYNPVPVAIDYRGEKDRLFKRDFAKDLQQKFPSLRLIDYGFKYRYDNNFPQDDITWFLFEK